MSFTAYQRLNKVLKTMAPENNSQATSFSYQNIIDIMKSSYSFSDKDAKIISNQIHQILEKLMRDGYITLDEKRIKQENLGDIGYKYYIITFEGEIFLKNGGYIVSVVRKWVVDFPKTFWWAIAILTFFAGRDFKCSSKKESNQQAQQFQRTLHIYRDTCLKN